MRRIIKCRVALMEKDVTTKIENENKAAFIIRLSGTFLPEEYLSLNGQDIDGEFPLDEYKEFIQNSVVAIYENLLSKSDDKPVDTVGLWFDFDDEKKLETSMDIATLNLIGEGQGLNPVSELTKMTLEVAYESAEG